MYEVEQIPDEKLSYDPVINSETLNTIATKFIGDKDHEHFLVLALNTKHEIIGVHVAHIGQLNSSLIHPREIFKILIMCNAAAFAIAPLLPESRIRASQTSR